MKSVLALSLLLFAASAAQAGPAEPAPGSPGLAPSPAQGTLSDQEVPPSAGAAPAPGALPRVLATDFSARLGLSGLGSCGAKAGEATLALQTVDEIPPFPRICCYSNGVTCCPAPRTCVLCDWLICCNPPAP
jgi:hypothetical protein